MFSLEKRLAAFCHIFARQETTNSTVFVSNAEAVGLGEAKRMPTQDIMSLKTKKRSLSAPPLFVDK
jgi:hypothetical protein